MNQPGKLFLFEGVNGAGKTTQIELFISYLISLGYPVMKVIEPDGAIREEIFRLGNEKKLTPEKAFELFFEWREILYNDTIKPAIQNGIYIVQDRGWPSSYAMQYILGELPRQMFDDEMKRIFGTFKPDAIILLNPKPDIEIARAICERINSDQENQEKRQKQNNPFRDLQDTRVFPEAKLLARILAYQQVKEEDAEYGKNTWITVDAGMTRSEVHQEIVTELRQKLILPGEGRILHS